MGKLLVIMKKVVVILVVTVMFICFPSTKSKSEAATAGRMKQYVLSGRRGGEVLDKNMLQAYINSTLFKNMLQAYTVSCSNRTGNNPDCINETPIRVSVAGNCDDCDGHVMRLSESAFETIAKKEAKSIEISYYYTL